MRVSDDDQLRGVVAHHAKRDHALLCYMLQTQDDEEKRDMSDNYCRSKIPFTLMFDSPRAGTHNCMQICACTCVKILNFGEKLPGRVKILNFGEK